MTNSDKAISGPIDLKLAVGRLKPSATVVKYEASVDDRENIANLIELENVKRFSAAVEASRWRKDGAQLALSISVDITQSCVATGDPVEEVVEAESELKFLPADGRHKSSGSAKDYDHLPNFDVSMTGEIDADDPPEEFFGDSIDLGAVLLELFSISIDPFPRSPDAPEDAIARELTTPEEEDASPFAALKALKSSADE
ncbi:MAG: hypothetical protein AAF468_20785 [Pseudomonadota bacterium]